jgi:hypothetical protein
MVKIAPGEERIAGQQQWCAAYRLKLRLDRGL